MAIFIGSVTLLCSRLGHFSYIIKNSLVSSKEGGGGEGERGRQEGGKGGEGEGGGGREGGRGGGGRGGGGKEGEREEGRRERTLTASYKESRLLYRGLAAIAEQLPIVPCFFNPLPTNDAYMRHELP